MLRLLRSVIAIFYLWNCNGKIHVSFAVAPQTIRVMVGLCNTYTTKVKKAWNLWNTWVENIFSWQQHVAPESTEDFRKWSLWSDNDSFSASKGWLHRFVNRFGLENINVTRDAPSANKEAAAAFLAELNKLIKKKGQHTKQIFSWEETGLFWSRMPKRTYVNKSEKEVPGQKTQTGRVTLVLSGNILGHIFKATHNI